MKRMIILAIAMGICLFAIRTTMQADDKTAAEYGRKAAGIDKQEADTLAELADWSRQKELPNQAYQLAMQALILQPKHTVANAVLDQLRGEAWRPKSYNIELSLIDGSQLRGSADLRQVTLNSEYGMLSFPVRQVQLVAYNFIGGQDLVIADGMSMVGKAGIGMFTMDTKVGRVNVEETSLKQLRIVRTCESCGGKGKTVCANCQGKGVLSGKRVCPTCKGVDSKKTCKTCNGKGSWHIARNGFVRDFTCPKCKGTGRLPCPDCGGKGGNICQTCKGTGFVVDTGVCPVCNGTKISTCQVCQGTGEQSIPKPVWPIREESPKEAPATAPAEAP